MLRAAWTSTSQSRHEPKRAGCRFFMSSTSSRLLYFFPWLIVLRPKEHCTSRFSGDLGNGNREETSQSDLNSTETMKEFKLPQKLEDLENAESEFFSAATVVDLESCDAESCMEMLGSEFNSYY